jgi:hypothetical protein
VVTDALSRKSLHVSTMMIHDMKLLEKFRDLHADVSCYNASLSLCKVDVKSTLGDQIRETRRYDRELHKLKKQDDFSMASDGMILFRDRVCVRVTPKSRRRYLRRTTVANNLYTLGLPRCIKT